MIPFRVRELRVNTSGKGPVASFDVEFGEEARDSFTPLFLVKDFALFHTESGEYFSRGPNKIITDKAGNSVMKEGTNYPLRLEFWQPIWEGEKGHRRISAKSGTFRDAITAEAVDVYNAQKDEPAAPKRTREAPVATKVSSKISSGRKTGTPVGGPSDDEDLPF